MFLDTVLSVQEKIKEMAQAFDIVSSRDQVVGIFIDREIIVTWKSGSNHYHETKLPLYYLMMTKEEYKRDRGLALERQREQQQEERNDSFFQWLDAKKFLERCNEEGRPIASYGEKYDKCREIYNAYKDTFESIPEQKELEDPPEEPQPEFVVGSRVILRGPFNGEKGEIKSIDHDKGLSQIELDRPVTIPTKKEGVTNVQMPLARLEMEEPCTLKGLTCDTCKKPGGQVRIDNELPAGTHCDKCWDKILNECRGRSY